MDDSYLKTVFWLMVILYTVAVIGIWENFAKPIGYFAGIYLSPILAYVWGLLVR